ncbi:glycosyltransferase family 2 protein [Maribacter algicola]|uniref:Glycosyltransferase family 2 protein n=1 Tax=Maribacter algicola TaxID=2498892 RepID=A0A3R8R7L1_9FLAO|nr:glycosyltransferase family 2 protein [Maribacter algicola]RRQ48743.1 glycosyltransferase family 2 protein [Maribacter algicola]
MVHPLVSIIIPFKNTSAYLEECLNSVLSQSYSHWEIIAVDDNSTDASLKLVQGFAQKDTRINVYPNTGKGVIQALQTAYAHCRGSFITRMDSDDIMTPDRLQVMTNLLLEHGEGHVAVGQVKYFSDRGISDGYDRYEKWLNGLTEKGTNFTEIYKECVIPSPCWMVYRSDFEACEGFNPQRYPEDYDLTFRFYEKGLHIIPCDKTLLYWRDYDHRTSRTSEHYAQNYFLDIKLHYFLKLDHDTNRPLVVWGAGFKGKRIAQSLTEKNIEFSWICDNPKKIGKEIYGHTLLSFQELDHIKHPQSIITVANEEAQKEIRAFFKQRTMRNMLDYFFLC